MTFKIAGLLVLFLLAPREAASQPRNTDVRPVSETSSTESELRSRGWVIDSLGISGAGVPGTRRVRAVGRIRLPAGQVWHMLADPSPEAAASWPGIKECVVEFARDDTTIARYLVAVPVFKDRRYRLRNVMDPARREASFVKVPGYGNVDEIRGSWKIDALSDSLTRVDYRADVDPGVRLVPGFIVSWATKHAIPRLFAHIYERASRNSWAQNERGPTG